MANAQVPTFVPNGRGGQHLVYFGYKFCIKSRNGDRVHWKCCKKTCRCTIKQMKKRKHRALEEALDMYKRQFISGAKSTVQYLDTVSNLIGY